LISIITATYNSSHLLRYAIKSIIDSDYDNWELIVVGDCCTDDSEEVVSSFADPRISFFNLDKNSGQQARPTNFGLSQVKGDYVAFLNQDDLFFPDHLSACVSEIENSGAEFLIIPGIKILKSSPESFNKGDYGVQLVSVHPDNKFSTNVFSVASTWFLKKTAAEKIGNWKMENELYVTPSQEWIFRASLLGIRFHFPRRVGTLIILSGERKNFYRQGFSPEHDFFSQRLTDQDLKAKLLEKAGIFALKELQNQLFFQPKVLVKRVFGLPLDGLFKLLKIHPSAIRNRKVWGGKGGLIRMVRKENGL
jgi:glycosyltransferase involved in cell wall biosynthesis